MTESPNIPADFPPDLVELLRKKGPVRRQHFVPVSHLARFKGADGLLALLNTKERRIERRRHGPRGCAFAPYFYGNWEGKGDLMAQVAEIMFESLEDHYGKSVPPILAKMRTQERLTIDDKRMLCYWMAMLWLRNPQFRKWLNKGYAELLQQVGRLAAHVKGEAMFDEAPETFKEMPREQRQKVLEAMKGDYDLQVSNHLHFEVMVTKLTQHAKLFSILKWKVYVNRTSKPFITSDNPVSIIDVSEHPPGTILQRRHFLPLTPDLLVEAFDSGVDSKPIARQTILSDKDPQILRLNSAVAYCATKWAYASDSRPFNDILQEIERRESILGRKIHVRGYEGPVHGL